MCVMGLLNRIVMRVGMIVVSRCVPHVNEHG